MIRIDLSRDEFQKSKPSLATQMIVKLNLAKLTGSKKAPDVGALLTFGFAAAVAFLPLLFVSQYKQYIRNEHEAEIKSIRDNINQIIQEIVKLGRYQRELESYESEKKLVEQRLGIIRQLLAARGTPVNILDAVGQGLPTGAWLSEIELANVKEGAPLVTIAGASISNEEISDFMDKLSESVYFSDVNLDDVTSAAAQKGTPLKNFHIIAHSKYRESAPNAGDPNGGSAVMGVAGQNQDGQPDASRSPADGTATK